MLKRFLLATAGVLVLGFSVSVLAADIQAGKALYKKKGCAACHGTDGMSVNLEQFPAISVQSSAYIAEELHDFKDGSRQGEGPGVIMNTITKTLSKTEIKNLAAYIESMP